MNKIKHIFQDLPFYCTKEVPEKTLQYVIFFTGLKPTSGFLLRPWSMDYSNRSTVRCFINIIILNIIRMKRKKIIILHPCWKQTLHKLATPLSLFFFIFFLIIIVIITFDTWHQTPDTSHLTCDTWHKGGGENCLKIWVSSSYCWLTELLTKLFVEKPRPFTKPPLFQRKRLTGSSNLTLESYVTGKSL